VHKNAPKCSISMTKIPTYSAEGAQPLPMQAQPLWDRPTRQQSLKGSVIEYRGNPYSLSSGGASCKGARSFRGQKILNRSFGVRGVARIFSEGALFPLEIVDDLFSRRRSTSKQRPPTPLIVSLSK